MNTETKMQAVKIGQTVVHSGPLPPPEELVAFAKISPDFPERIIHMAELEQQHRFECDRSESAAQKQELDRVDYIVRTNSRNTLLGMFVSLFVVLAIMAVTAWCAYLHQPWPASILGAGGLSAIVVAIMYGSRIKQKN